ncbi:MAG TPA: hypothetical protein VGS27_17155 [Candidatus Sulfotelmatobacter sp.]|nr:hypothetical protein [Candidatus Sulfotelmatobacter sp.]
MAFVVTGAYIAILFSAGMFFVWRGRRRPKNDYAEALKEAAAAMNERRREERRRIHA